MLDKEQFGSTVPEFVKAAIKHLGYDTETVKVEAVVDYFLISSKEGSYQCKNNFPSTNGKFQLVIQENLN